MFEYYGFKQIVFIFACVLWVTSIIMFYVASFIDDKKPKTSDVIFNIANILFWLSIIFVFISSEKSK